MEKNANPASKAKPTKIQKISLLGTGRFRSPDDMRIKLPKDTQRSDMLENRLPGNAQHIMPIVNTTNQATNCFFEIGVGFISVILPNVEDEP